VATWAASFLTERSQCNDSRSYKGGLAPKARNPPAEFFVSPVGGLRRCAPNPPYGLSVLTRCRTCCNTLTDTPRAAGVASAAFRRICKFWMVIERCQCGALIAGARFNSFLIPSFAQ
jgi:hypothetical protein